MNCLPLSIFLGGLLIVASQAAVAAPTAVTCGDVIDAPGQYLLSDDCAGDRGITISISHVDLNLDGHTMTSTGSSTSIGIFASQVADVHIQGPGGIIGYSAAIVLEGVDKVEVVNVTCVGNADGLELSSHSTRNRIVNSAFDDGSVGPGILLALSTDNHIDGNEVNGNRGGGISLANGATGNQIHANTAFGSLSGPDMADGNPNCDSNDWDGNHFGTANPSSCIK